MLIKRLCLIPYWMAHCKQIHTNRKVTLSPLDRILMKRKPSKQPSEEQRYFPKCCDKSILLSKNPLSQQLGGSRCSSDRAKFVCKKIEQIVKERLASGEFVSQFDCLKHIKSIRVTASKSNINLLWTCSNDAARNDITIKQLQIQNMIRFTLASERILGNVLPIKMIYDQFDEAVEILNHTLNNFADHSRNEAVNEHAGTTNGQNASVNNNSEIAKQQEPIVQYDTKRQSLLTKINYQQPKKNFKSAFEALVQKQT
ncbi:hypothetical protein GJ496_002694 [Pomphorhynchus laevis]|nr:hypothetical protein GJ496_002694 [Pomphorhynchus laevis]